MSQQKRILALGSTNHSKLVTSYLWNDLPTNINVADYDVVVLNLVPMWDRSIAESLDVTQLPPRIQFMRQIFGDDSEIIAVGLPGLGIGNKSQLRTDWWLPIGLSFVFDGGTKLSVVEPSFCHHFDKVTKWYFHLANLSWPMRLNDPELLTTIEPNGDTIQITERDLATTRFHNAIGFELQVTISQMVVSFDGVMPDYGLQAQSVWSDYLATTDDYCGP